jgi:ParB/RepB/Spo0J family partition protein
MSETIQVALSEIVDSRWQTRQDGYSGPEFDELVQSVKKQGIVNPPGVFRNEAGEWELVYGHRRVAAARQAGCTSIPITRLDDGCQITDTAMPTLERFQQMVIADNLYHEDLRPLEVARALQELIGQQGLSQGEVAAIYGKSQQWVSDKLRLLDLAPEVQEKLTARAVEESVARKLAQLPEDVQPEVAKHIEGRPSREATQIVQEIQAATEPEYWDLPEDRPWSPGQINVKAMMDDCLAKVPQEKMGRVLVNLSKAYMLQRPAVAGYWGMDRFAKVCGLKGQNLEKWQAEHGRDCEQCLFAGEGLFGDCGRPGTKTCPRCLIAIDEVRLPYPDAKADCADCVSEGKWCTDLSCYIDLRKKELAVLAASHEEEDLEQQIAAQDELRAFYDRQMQPDVQCNHWLAQACGTCGHWRGPGQKDQCGAEDPGYIETSFWQSDEMIVPICDGYRLGNLQSLPEIDQSKFDEILIGWIEASVHKLGRFLAGEKLEDRKVCLHEANLSRKQLVTLLGYAANPYLSRWAKSAEVANPITGELSEWTRVEEPDEAAQMETEEGSPLE